jgi:AcrR family transcriptional regulator
LISIDLNNVKMESRMAKTPRAKAAAKRSGGGRAKTAERPYHLGDLREKLIAATEALILERGVDGFSLREVARRAGVSPAAPSHHFGDAKGLLAEVAYLGFREFADALMAADAKGGADPRSRLYEQGLAYVRFALKNPARFTLMFRHDTYGGDGHAGLGEASARAYAALENAIRAATGTAPGAPLQKDGFGLLLATWSIVHGFAHLALGGELQHAQEMAGIKSGVLDYLLPLTLQHLPSAKG